MAQFSRNVIMNSSDSKVTTGVQFPAGVDIFSFTTTSRQGLWSNQLPFRCVPAWGGGGTSSPRKRDCSVKLAIQLQLVSRLTIHGYLRPQCLHVFTVYF
jgi:hypothetical protein